MLQENRPEAPSRDLAAPSARARDLDVAVIQSLKERSNTVNFAYIGANYLIIIATIFATIWSYGAVAEAGLGWWWNVPATIAAMIIMGGTQHNFGGAIHEAAHFMLFKNRMLNEIASDLLVAFPIYTSTYQYRVQHLAHHQFVNDPVRDPDISQLKESEHWLDFPMPQIDFLRAIARALLPSRLIRYTITRAKYSAVGFEGHAYFDPEKTGSKWTVRLGLLFAVLLPIVAARMTRWEHGSEALWLIGASWLAIMAYYLAIPESSFTATRLEPVISHRATAIARLSYLGVAYAVLTYLHLSGYQAWNYCLLFWYIPLFTTFPLFMVLRQWVQHGNADRGRYTNTRVFLVNPLMRYCVFPWGQDYHLPHHLQASVPHYNLKHLHEVMLRDPEYCQKATVLNGLFHHPEGISIAEALSPEHAPKSREKVHVDNDSLEYANVADKAAIAREAEKSAQVE